MEDKKLKVVNYPGTHFTPRLFIPSGVGAQVRSRLLDRIGRHYKDDVDIAVDLGKISDPTSLMRELAAVCQEEGLEVDEETGKAERFTSEVSR
jgi:hypothetical protein